MSECPLSRDGGQNVLEEVCSVQCRIQIEKGSLAAVSLFEEHWEIQKECKHESLVFVRETMQAIGDMALRRYVVVYACTTCYVELEEQNGYEFECRN